MSQPCSSFLSCDLDCRYLSLPVISMVGSMPAEIIQIIFKYAISERRSTSDVCDLLCVCSAWRDIDLYTIWSDIVVGFQQLSTFVRSVSTTQKTLSLVKSFTFISLPQQNEPEDLQDRELTIKKGNRRSRQLNVNIAKLATLIPFMYRLKNFSFHIKCARSNEILSGFYISRHALTSLISSLPSTVVGLEIDTKCQDRVTEAEGSL